MKFTAKQSYEAEDIGFICDIYFLYYNNIYLIASKRGK